MTLLNPKCKQHQPPRSDYLAYNIFAAIQAVHESFWVAYTQFIHPLALGVVHVFAQCQARPVSGRDIWSRVVAAAATTPTTPTTLVLLLTDYRCAPMRPRPPNMTLTRLPSGLYEAQNHKVRELISFGKQFAGHKVV
jgi:hypothetical protein